MRAPVLWIAVVCAGCGSTKSDDTGNPDSGIADSGSDARGVFDGGDGSSLTDGPEGDAGAADSARPDAADGGVDGGPFDARADTDVPDAVDAGHDATPRDASDGDGDIPDASDAALDGDPPDVRTDGSMEAGGVCTIVEGASGTGGLYPSVAAAYADVACLEIYLPARVEPYPLAALNVSRTVTLRGDSSVDPTRSVISPPPSPDGGLLPTRLIVVTGGTVLTLRDLELTGGVNDGAIDPQVDGGALGVSSGDVLAERVVFRGNRSPRGGAVGLGALFVGGGTHTFREVQFIGNSATRSGGAMYTQSIGSVLLLEDCLFDGNTLDVVDTSVFAAGAAAVLFRGASATIRRTRFTNNRMTSTRALGIWGGTLATELDRVVIEDSEFVGNEATHVEGLNPLQGGVLRTTTHTTIRRSLFESNVSTNTATGGRTEGGVLSFEPLGAASLAVEEALFLDNRATASGPIEGGVLRASCLGSNPATLRLVNTTVHQNELTTPGTLLGGGLIADSAGCSTLTSSLVNVTMTDQTISAGGAVTGASLYVSGTSAFNLRNSIIDHGSLPDCATATVLANVLTLMGDATGCAGASPFLTGDPNLAALSPGTDWTRVLLPMAPSPAIDAGASVCTDETGATVSVDQRGLTRDGSCDMGAADVGAVPP